MNYRIRWQQRRKQRRQKQLLLLPAVVLVALLVYGLVRLFSGGARVYWVQERPGLTFPRLAVGPSAVYTLWSDGHIHAFNPRDGASLGDSPLFSRPETLNTTPLLQNQVLYCGSELGLLRAIDARSGQLLWSFDAQSPLRTPPVLSGDRLYVGSEAGKVYSFDLSGKKQWVRELGTAVSGAGCVIGKTLIVANLRGEVFGLAVADGKLQWRQDLKVPVLAPVTAADPLVTVGSDTGSLYVLQAADGKVVESYFTAGLVRGAAAVDTTGLYFGSSDGWLRVVSRDGRNPLWALNLGGPITVGPVVEGGTLYVGGPGRLVALNLATGRVVRRWTREQFAGDLVVSNGILYVGTTTGKVLALAAP